MIEITFNGFEPPVFERLDEIILTLGDDDTFFIEHDHVHVQPFTAGIHGMTIWHIGFRAN